MVPHGSTWFQNVSNWCQMAPKWYQIVPNGSKLVPIGAKWSQMVPKWSTTQEAHREFEYFAFFYLVLLHQTPTCNNNPCVGYLGTHNNMPIQMHSMKTGICNFHACCCYASTFDVQQYCTTRGRRCRRRRSRLIVLLLVLYVVRSCPGCPWVETCRPKYAQ